MFCYDILQMVGSACYPIVIGDVYRKSTSSLWDNKGEWQSIIRGYSYNLGTILSNLSGSPNYRQRDPTQLDFWLGNRNNTIGYRPEISHLNRLKPRRELGLGSVIFLTFGRVTLHARGWENLSSVLT